jgi:hypothetical protein
VHHRSRGAVWIPPATCHIDHDLAQPVARSHEGHRRSRRSRRTKAQHDLGCSCGWEARRAKERIVGVDNAVERVHACSQPGQWLRQDRPAEAFGQRSDLVGRQPVWLGPAVDNAALAPNLVGDPRDEFARRGRRQRRLCYKLRSERLEWSPRLDKWLPEREVHVYRPGRGLRRQRCDTRSHRACEPEHELAAVSERHLQRALHVRAVEATLVDGLVGADVAQLGRPVGGQHDERDARERGLDYRGHEIGRCRAGRTDERDRLAPLARKPEREISRRPLVEL